MSDITRILSAKGDSQKSSELLPLVYDELHKLAAVRLAQEKPGDRVAAKPFGFLLRPIKKPAWAE